MKEGPPDQIRHPGAGRDLGKWRDTPYGELAGAFVFVGALLVYGVVAARWFARHLDRSFARGLVHVAFSLGEGIAMTILLALLFRP